MEISVGVHVGRWTVVGLGERRSYAQYWKCRCDCGTEREVSEATLRGKVTPLRPSCGCGRRERFLTHGMHDTPEYAVWGTMLARCGNPHVKSWPSYGGRGIAVCERWASSFGAFIADMGRRPSRRHELDRIDNDGPYAPENCRWASKKQQGSNKRNNVRIEHAGLNLTLPEWSARTGLRAATIWARIKRGWSAKRVLSTPADEYHHRT